MADYVVSSDLMKAIRDLDVAGQVAVLDAFVDFYSKYPTSSSPLLCDRFCDDYATYHDHVDTDYDWMYLRRTLWSMEIIVDEMDITDPSNFYTLCSELDKVIKKQKNYSPPQAPEDRD